MKAKDCKFGIEVIYIGVIRRSDVKLGDVFTINDKFATSGENSFVGTKGKDGNYLMKIADLCRNTPKNRIAVKKMLKYYEKEEYYRTHANMIRTGLKK